VSKSNSEIVIDFYSQDVLDAYESSAVYKKQIGGSHYLNKIQPWDIIDSWELNFYEGNILKYLLRDKSNRVEDLQKLIHYAEKLIELESK